MIDINCSRYKIIYQIIGKSTGADLWIEYSTKRYVNIITKEEVILTFTQVCNQLNSNSPAGINYNAIFIFHLFNA
jgi:hypothetical protein